MADVLPTGQAFHWNKTESDPPEWTGAIGDKYIRERHLDIFLFAIWVGLMKAFNCDFTVYSLAFLSNSHHLDSVF